MMKSRPRGDVVHQYSRSQAIDDGFLIDVTETTTEAGIAFPSALTATAWEACVSTRGGGLCRNERERLWEIIVALYSAINDKEIGLWHIPFDVVLHDHAGRLHRIELIAMCSPDDEGEPAITVLMPNED